MNNTILIVEFGGQLTQLIVRRLRDVSIRAILVNPEKVPIYAPENVAGVILSGGPSSVNEDDAKIARIVLQWGLPVLGICYGHQLLVHAAGGHVEPQNKREYGRETLQVIKAGYPLFDGLFHETQVWMSHGDSVTQLPEYWEVAARTKSCGFAAVVHHSTKQFGVQFHPEAAHTERGVKLLEKFAVDVCGIEPTYTAASLVDEMKDAIQRKMGPEGHVMIGCSLGVDSTTVTKLFQDALGLSRVHPIFIDTGLLRQEDIDMILIGKELFPGLEVVDAHQLFINSLQGICDPEEKRQKIGNCFWDTFSRQAKRLGKYYPIACYSQGTISPDVIESGESSDRARIIKSHHNLVPRPKDFPFEPYEPLRDFWLYKDQVRKVGEAIGIPHSIFGRHPFPGPGLAIRISGEFTKEKLEIARAADAIWMQELRKIDHHDSVSQATAVVTSDKSVCVQGDERHYGWTVALSAFHTDDFMTAQCAEFSFQFLRSVASRISSEIPGVGRTTYGLNDKPPATIEWE